MIHCESVILSRGDDQFQYFVQYDDTELGEREDCLHYLGDCGYEITTEPHRVLGPGDGPAVSWGDLSDIMEPRDD